MLDRADEVASQFGFKFFKAGAAGWRIWLCWPGPRVVLGSCALFSCTQSLVCAWGLASFGEWCGKEGSTVGLSPVLTCRDPCWPSGGEPAAI